MPDIINLRHIYQRRNNPGSKAPTLITKEKFLSYMEEIDSELSKEDCPFHQRPLRAFTKLADRVDKHGKIMMLPDTQVSEDDYSNDALCSQVHRWYKSKYGDRIKIHPGPGSGILLIKNEPWEVIYPLILGQANFTVDSDIRRKDRRALNDKGKRIPEVNILWHVADITPEIASSLSDKEKLELLKDYMFGFNAVQSLKRCNAPYMDQAKNDYDIAVFNIFKKYPDYNSSKWASLQFAEKTMKSKLQVSGVDFKYSHDLSYLAKKLDNIGIKIEDCIIKNIQCEAGVRYGEISVTRIEAVTAVRNALILFSKVFPAPSFEFEIVKRS